MRSLIFPTDSKLKRTGCHYKIVELIDVSSCIRKIRDCAFPGCNILDICGKTVINLLFLPSRILM